ncbi:bifunctional diaminohydroxyphosphoribosylaminopyrimidine deaminase/5-amino-6-(5-phosphoribosylamino)uracil reductase RibD [Cytobacillus solani]|uniref:Riboflavin biosynthesis protein RibD n=1 Tax=Cytobacillus solani TaxID=1637975 RepID=A0A0Q3T9Q3_9BACI|nr:bifunctional diaminohydroxyphosphoribosylaminopyrimidine deaminase/5-amino-6-(5-phosphoribosylamino)uracil reductase RibD [Cytobacillus solani]KOP83053.1 5-amino-6-(5-phosphoribosylamino)uracil reductase [Bacillus sp. FJAT-21945]KQL20077.1 5-amino-6-(5-phosphoribosylamino)uracil reductase [Cytobacillus solani]USK53326.1 bifunctional diaminohydroxyphosphoribosylaminopyrimidine deaminase/5-amino-6-(5-phosphoribosylamino)uracil reductase RibD [Cytobacillus solani]
MKDEEYMKLALRMALSMKGQTNPNPIVGAVVVKNGQIIGMGAHLKAGTAHAEVHAIRMAGNEANGADLYVTLEPCSHFGKTPPCTALICKSGIKRVVIAVLDPNPLAAGQGIAQLKRAGIEVEVGVGKEDAYTMNEPFFHFIQTNTPYVTIKSAASLDGKTAAKTGDSKWITSPESRLDVHQLRHEHDAILTGVNTIIHDNPHLTTRLPRGGKNPIRIVLDTHLRTPVESNVIQDGAAKTIIFTGREINENKVEAIQQYGVEVFPFSTQTVLIPDVLNELGSRNIMSVLVEGGSEIHASFVKNDAFQQIVLYIAPIIIGGKEAIPFIGETGIEFVKHAKKLSFESIEYVGKDIKLLAKPIKEG